MPVRKLRVLSEKQFFNFPKCGFQYYNGENKRMEPCGKKSVFFHGKPRVGICIECGTVMNANGFTIVMPNGAEYDAIKDVLEILQAEDVKCRE